MSLTPLHIAAGYTFRRQMHFWSFAWANIWMDIPVVAYVMNDTLGDLTPGDTLHGLHTLNYAILVVIGVAVAFRSWKALDGALIGVLSHLLIDAIYHADVMPEWGLHGILPMAVVDLLLLGIFVAPIGWQALKRFAAKRPD